MYSIRLCAKLRLSTCSVKPQKFSGISVIRLLSRVRVVNSTSLPKASSFPVRLLLIQSSSPSFLILFNDACSGNLVRLLLPRYRIWSLAPTVASANFFQSAVSCSPLPSLAPFSPSMPLLLAMFSNWISGSSNRNSGSFVRLGQLYTSTSVRSVRVLHAQELLSSLNDLAYSEFSFSQSVQMSSALMGELAI